LPEKKVSKKRFQTLIRNPLSSPKATRWTLFSITWVAFLLRVTTLGRQSLWRDEVDAIRFSSWTLAELVSGLVRAGHNGPLFFLLLRPWRTLTGDSEFALRYPSALLGTLLIPLGFILARQLRLGRWAGVMLGLLLATSPYLVWYGQEAKMYSLLALLILLAFIAYLKALAGPGSMTAGSVSSGWPLVWWVVFVAATSLSFYTHILSPLMLIVYGLIGLLHYPQLRQRWRGWLISMAFLTLPYLPLALWQFRLLLAGFHSGHPFYPLQRQINLLLQLYTTGVISFSGSTAMIGLAAITLFVFLFLCGLFLKEKVSHPTLQGQPPDIINRAHQPHQASLHPAFGLTTRLSLAAWVLLPALIVYLISLRVAVFEDRYLIYITPAFYLMIVLGLMRVRQYGRWLASLGLLLILLINLRGIWVQQSEPIKPDFRGAAQYLSQASPSPATIMIQIPYLQHTLAYYYRGDYTLLEGLWTNDDKSPEVVAAEMIRLTAGLDDLWLIVSEEDLWDQRHLTRSWLNENAELTDEVHFIRVEVYRYQLPSEPIEIQSIGQQ
jgi:uncharacterized membrane protein